jgi:hypothetical protein
MTNLVVHIDNDADQHDVAELTRTICEDPQLVAVDEVIMGRNGARYRVTKIEIRPAANLASK